MIQFLDSVANAVLCRSPHEWIGALLIALTIALAMTALYTLAYRRFRDRSVLIITLILVANVASMTLAAGYLLRAEANSEGAYNGIRFRGEPSQYPSSPPSAALSPGTLSPQPSDALAVFLRQRVFDLADRNQDGLLSVDEAAIAAEDFLRTAHITPKDPIDGRSFDEALKTALFPTLDPSTNKRVSQGVTATE